MSAAEGSFCLVLHSHLPWLPHHGAWPVGEEWLYQAWAHSYLPVVDLLRRFAERGPPRRADARRHPGARRAARRPVRAARAARLARQLAAARAVRGRAVARGDPLLRDLAAAEYRAAGAALDRVRGPLAARVLAGAAPARGRRARRAARRAGDAPVPAAAATRRCARFALRTGLADTALRVGRAPAGIWAPECGYAPGMERGYAAAGVRRFLVDGPALHGDTHAARPVGDVGRGVLRPRPRGHLPGVVAEGRLPGRPGVPRLPHVRPPERARSRRGSPASTCRRSEKRPYDPALAAAAVAPARRRLRGDRRRAAAVAARAARPARARRRRVRHRAVRPLVARGPGVAGGGAARAAGGRRAGDDVARRDRGRARGRAGRAAGVLVGVAARTGGCGTASRCRTWCRRARRVQDELLALPTAGPGTRDPVRDQLGARGAADAVERLGVHGHEGLGGRLRAPAREGARRPVRRAGEPGPRRRSSRAPGGGRPSCAARTGSSGTWTRGGWRERARRIARADVVVGVPAGRGRRAGPARARAGAAPVPRWATRSSCCAGTRRAPTRSRTRRPTPCARACGWCGSPRTRRTCCSRRTSWRGRSRWATRMIRAGLALLAGVAAGRRARARLAGHAPGDRAGRARRRAAGGDASTRPRRAGTAGGCRSR